MGLDAEDRQWILDTLEQNLGRMERKFDEKLDEKLEGMETRLLTAFHEWASPVALRLDSNRAALRTFDIELETLQNRVKKIEEKLGMGLV
jgi:hypothetical protein